MEQQVDDKGPPLLFHLSWMHKEKLCWNCQKEQGLGWKMTSHHFLSGDRYASPHQKF
jgi:hypothetical protein